MHKMCINCMNRSMCRPIAPVVAIQRSEAAARTRPIGLRIAILTLRLLENWRAHLGLDHDCALIVMATAAITMEKFTRLELEPEHRDVRAVIPPQVLTRCNVSSIAAATGLNRETARRKVRLLVQDGVLLADGKGSLRLSPDYTRAVPTDDMSQRKEMHLNKRSGSGRVPSRHGDTLSSVAAERQHRHSRVL